MTVIYRQQLLLHGTKKMKYPCIPVVLGCFSFPFPCTGGITDCASSPPGAAHQRGDNPDAGPGTRQNNTAPLPWQRLAFVFWAAGVFGAKRCWGSPGLWGQTLLCWLALGLKYSSRGSSGRVNVGRQR